MSPEPISVAEAGRKGARTRWGPPRVVRLDSLNDAQRAVVLALIDTMKPGTVSETSAPGSAEVRPDEPRSAS